MKILLFLTFMLFTLSNTSNFSGEWSYNDDDSSFDIDLKQEGSKITGQHSSIALSGRRIDAAYGDEQTISGTVTGNEANVTIKSGYSGEKGTAKITWLGPDSIRFEMVNPKDIGFIPSKVTLKKVK